MSAEPRRRARRRWLLAVGICIGLLLSPIFGGSLALAHAELISTDPAAGAVLDVAPNAITLEFSESVDLSLGAVRLFDGRGDAVDVGAVDHPDGRSTTVRADLGELANGSYVVDWRVVSSDGHPIAGAFSFQVGPTSDLQPGILDEILGRDRTSRSAGIALAIARVALTASLAIVFGGLVLLGVGIVAPAPRLRRVLWGAVVVGPAAGLLQLPIEVGYATGRSFGVIVDPDAWSIALDTRIGLAWMVRALIMLAAGAVAMVLVEHHRRRGWLAGVVAGLIGVGLASAWGGHGASGRWQTVGIIATAVHVAAMAVWIGGLVALVISLRSSARTTLSSAAASTTTPSTGGTGAVAGLGSAMVLVDVADDAAQTAVAGVRRFSWLALIMVDLVVLSGVVQSIRQVGSWEALTSTNYGRILLVKIALVAVIVGIGALSRVLVQRSAIDAQRLRRSVAVEVVVAVAIIVATALLMSSNPSQVAAGRPFSVTLVQNSYLASITIEPGRVGPNEMHIYLSNPDSSLVQPQEVTVQISDPSREVAAIEVPVERSGAGHFTASGATFPYAATWELVVLVRYSEFDEIRFETQAPIG